MLLIRSRRSCPVVFPLNFLVLLRFSSGLWIPDWYVTYRMSIQKRGFDQLPSWDDELPMLFDFETNIRLVGLTSNFQLTRTFTFFFTIFTQIYVFYHFLRNWLPNQILKISSCRDIFLLASQKPTNKQKTVDCNIDFLLLVNFKQLIANSKFSSRILEISTKFLTYATNLTEYTVRTL